MNNSAPDYIKCCANCKIDKPAVDFRPSPKHKGGLSSWCVACFRKSSKSHYEANKQKYNERRRALWKNKGI